MRNVFLRRVTKENRPRPTRQSIPRTPRWVNVLMILVIVLIVLLVIMHLTGNGFGDHMHMSIIEHERQHV
jgi:hypothetical protein